MTSLSNLYRRFADLIDSNPEKVSAKHNQELSQFVRNNAVALFGVDLTVKPFASQEELDAAARKGFYGNDPIKEDMP